ncbi:hypothetical protein UFOVP153_44 [uncultured Caudovirales phage]|uniref:Uncharacterized protein n=1 Tax=uncultured Caudovirales phage TaxID=2100421 RepID=A0A6J5KUZ0_9CAUD|nr:hypothetical protein UFOVP69_14 [uncultured Caudovirales phage]CAB5170888.1 hypothetical protein UFOVP153_44 [uncultured Caudovirales phage]
MARTIAQIQAQIVATKEAQPELAGLTSTSKRAIWNLWTFVIATCIGIFEQLLDSFMANVETQVAQSAGASILWLQAKMFEFQYDSAVPQIVQLINTVPQYPIVDPTKRIITACSVTSDLSNQVVLKVAKSDPFEALGSSELSSAQGYINTIGAAGIIYNVLSLNPDQLYVEATIYGQGQYSAILKQNVIDTLNSWLQTLSKTNFNGAIKISDLEGVIRNVEGVNDVVLNNVRGRDDASLFAAGIDLVFNNALVQRQWNTVAGYAIQETTSGKTFNDSLTFIYS